MFYIGDSGSVQLVMTCLLKASPSLGLKNPRSHVGTRDSKPAQQDHTAFINSRQVGPTVDRHTNNTQTGHESDSSKLPSRQDLESAYAKVIRLPDRDEQKVRGLSMLGIAYQASYQERRGANDLDKAISLHEEALDPFTHNLPSTPTILA